MWVPLRLVFECVAWTTSPCSCRVATLHHEVGNYTVKNRSIVKTFFRKKDKIVHGLRSVFSEKSTTIVPRGVSNVAVYFFAGSIDKVGGAEYCLLILFQCR